MFDPDFYDPSDFRLLNKALDTELGQEITDSAAALLAEIERKEQIDTGLPGMLFTVTDASKIKAILAVLAGTPEA